MSRRNRVLLESNPLPPLPEVDTTSTIESVRFESHLHLQRQINPQEDKPTGTELRRLAGANHQSTSSLSISLHDRGVRRRSLSLHKNPPKPSGIDCYSPSPRDFFSDIPLPPQSPFAISDPQETNAIEYFHEVPLDAGIELRQSPTAPSLLRSVTSAISKLTSARSRSSHAQASCKNTHLNFTAGISEDGMASSSYRSSPLFAESSDASGHSHRPAHHPEATGSEYKIHPKHNAYSVREEYPTVSSKFTRTAIQSGRDHDHVDGRSIADTSTVGNIYRHYLREDPTANISDDSSLSDISLAFPQEQPSSPRGFDKRHQPGAATSTSRDIVESGFNSINKLGMLAKNNTGPVPPQSSITRLPGYASNPQGPEPMSPIKLVQVGLTQNTYKDPQTLVGRTPNFVIDRANGNQFVYETGHLNIGNPSLPRLPLEREVSNALRRSSRAAPYSVDSLAESIIDRYRYFGRRTSVAPPLLSESPSQHGVEVMSNPDVSTDPVITNFYNQDALSASWVNRNQENAIRVPIRLNSQVSRPSECTTELLDLLATGSQQILPRSSQNATADEDNRDWETIGTRTSGLGIYDQNPYLGLVGGTVGRTGSSIADTSDMGINSTLEIDNLHLSQRIAQHPANLQYQAEYKQRTLKDTKAPIFAPRYRIHNVNGFLANSNRLQPQPLITNSSPHTLMKYHVNPFRESPPQVLQAPTGNSCYKRDKQADGPENIKGSSQTLDTEIGDEDYTKIDEPPSGFQGLSAEDRRNKTLEWMENFDEHKLEVRVDGHQHNSNGYPQASRPSSFFRAIGTVAKSVSGFLTKKHRQSTYTSDTMLRDLTLPGKMHIDGTEEYQHTKHNARGENGLKNLTLVDKLQPLTPQSLSSSHIYTASCSDDFIYRSPLAAPKKSTWKTLYSPSQLLGFQRSADTDGFNFSTGNLNDPVSTLGTQPMGSRRRIFETPTLRLWKRDEDTQTDLTHQKRNCSIMILCLCALFPPLLLLYIFGALDGLISWWTQGRYTTFAKSQRRLALIFLIVWITAIFIGLVVFLAYWFTNLRQQ